MRVAIFGATGRTGQRLVEEALGRDFEVSALARDPEKLGGGRGRLVVVHGDVLDPGPVQTVVTGADAVLVALGHTKTSTGDIQEKGTKNIVDAMRAHGVRRVVSLTGAGVRDPEDRPKLLDKLIVSVLRRVQPEVLRDAERHAEVLRSSGLDWTVVRGPVLTDSEKKGAYRVGYVGKNSGTRISRADIAAFMLDQVSDPAYVGQAPMLSY